MTIVRFRTYLVKAELPMEEHREEFEVTPVYRKDFWAAIMPDTKRFPRIGMHTSDPVIAIKDLMMRNGWHVNAVEPMD